MTCDAFFFANSDKNPLYSQSIYALRYSIMVAQSGCRFWIRTRGAGA